MIFFFQVVFAWKEWVLLLLFLPLISFGMSHQLVGVNLYSLLKENTFLHHEVSWIAENCLQEKLLQWNFNRLLSMEVFKKCPPLLFIERYFCRFTPPPRRIFASTAESLFHLELVSVVPIGMEYNRHIGVFVFLSLHVSVKSFSFFFFPKEIST